MGEELTDLFALGLVERGHSFVGGGVELKISLLDEIIVEGHDNGPSVNGLLGHAVGAAFDGALVEGIS